MLQLIFSHTSNYKGNNDKRWNEIKTFKGCFVFFIFLFFFTYIENLLLRQQEIPELSSKWILVHSLSYGKFIHTQILLHLHVNKTNFHMKGFGLGLTRYETEAKGNWEMGY